jgi:hypothetical protein
MRLRSVTLFAVLATQAGCATMRPVNEPATFLAGRSPGVIVVVSNDGKATEIAAPKLVADTVYGFNAEGDEVTIPVSTVQQLIAKQVHVGRTVLLGIAAAGATALLATAVLGLGSDTPPDPIEGEPEDLRSRQRIRTRIPLIRIGIPF